MNIRAIAYFSISVNNATACLMRSKDKYFSYLYMLWSTCSIEGYISNIGTSQRFDALIYIVCTLVVTMETHVAEVCLNQSWFQVCHTYGRFSHINAQSIGNCLNRGLRSTIHIATCVCSITSHTAYVDYMTFVAFHHSWDNEASHGKQSLDVGVNHRVPILRITFILLLQSKCKTCIVDEYINRLPFLFERSYGILCCLCITNIKHKCLDLCAF